MNNIHGAAHYHFLVFLCLAMAGILACCSLRAGWTGCRGWIRGVRA